MLESLSIGALRRKYRPLNLYKASVTAHSAAAHDLSLTRWQTPKHEYERLWQTAEKAKRNRDRSGEPSPFPAHTRTRLLTNKLPLWYASLH